MTSPLEMFGLQYKFAKNGRGFQERGIDMEYYVTQEVLTSQLTGASENITIALSMSGGIVQVEGEDSIEYNVPESSKNILQSCILIGPKDIHLTLLVFVKENQISTYLM